MCAAIEGEIRALNGKASRTASESKELDALKEELARIMKAKADCTYSGIV